MRSQRKSRCPPLSSTRPRTVCYYIFCLEFPPECSSCRLERRRNAKRGFVGRLDIGYLRGMKGNPAKGLLRKVSNPDTHEPSLTQCLKISNKLLSHQAGHNVNDMFITVDETRVCDSTHHSHVFLYRLPINRSLKVEGDVGFRLVSRQKSD